MSRREGSGSPGLPGPMRQPPSVPLHCAVCQQRQMWAGEGPFISGHQSEDCLGSSAPPILSICLFEWVARPLSKPTANSTERKRPVCGQQGSLCCFPNGTQVFSQN